MTHGSKKRKGKILSHWSCLIKPMFFQQRVIQDSQNRKRGHPSTQQWRELTGVRRFQGSSCLTGGRGWQGCLVAPSGPVEGASWRPGTARWMSCLSGASCQIVHFSYTHQDSKPQLSSSTERWNNGESGLYQCTGCSPFLGEKFLRLQWKLCTFSPHSQHFTYR